MLYPSLENFATGIAITGQSLSVLSVLMIPQPPFFNTKVNYWTEKNAVHMADSRIQIDYHFSFKSIFILTAMLSIKNTKHIHLVPLHCVNILEYI